MCIMDALQKCTMSITMPERVNIDGVDDDEINICNSDSQNSRLGKLNIKYL